MDDLEFRRTLYADPTSSDRRLQSAKNADQSRQKFAQEVVQLEHKINNALNVPVPDDLCEKLILRQSLASYQLSKKNSRIKLAIATSVAFIIGLTVNHLQFSHAHSTIADYAIAHVKYEAHYFSNEAEANITLATLNKKMSLFNGEFSQQLGELIMADYCRFDGIKSLHLIFRGQVNLVNVFIVPQTDHLQFSKAFSKEQFNGAATNYKHSQIIVVGDKNEPLSQWQENIDKSVRWSI